jgi:hypothetical protein
MSPIVWPTQVIGPYRSGKSFLLNQLLSLSCDKGRCCLAPPSIISRRLDEMHSRTNVKLMNLTMQVLELVICGIRKLKVVFFVQIQSSFSFIINLLMEAYKLWHACSSIAGIWIWGTPVEIDVDGTKVSVLYLDTEGFESVGKSNVYDDRFVLRC